MQGIDIKKVKCANCNLHDNLYKHDHKWLCMKCLALYFPKKKCNECKKQLQLYMTINGRRHIFCNDCISEVFENETKSEESETSDDFLHNFNEELIIKEEKSISP